MEVYLGFRNQRHDAGLDWTERYNQCYKSQSDLSWYTVGIKYPAASSKTFGAWRFIIMNEVISVGSFDKSHHLVGVMTPRNQVDLEAGYLFLGSIEEPVTLTN